MKIVLARPSWNWPPAACRLATESVCPRRRRLPFLSFRFSPCHAARRRARKPRTAPAQRKPHKFSEAASSLATLRLHRPHATRSANLRFRHLLDFGQHQRRFVLQRSLHRVEVAFRIFSGAKLKTQVSQIVVNGVAPLHQLVQLGAMRREVGSIGLDVENKKQRGNGQRQACAKHCAIGRRNRNRSCQIQKSASHQSSVSSATRRRARSSNSVETPDAEVAPAVWNARAGRFRHRLITETTRIAPASKYTTGIAHAKRPIPVCGGSINATCPYSCTNDCTIKSSESPRATCWSILFSIPFAVPQGPEKAPPT